MPETLSVSILGLVQGITEFLPVSSTGHLILARDVFGISTDHGLAVDAVLQLATALAVVVYFFKDILNLFYTALYKITGRPADPSELKVLGALILGTIPAIILGLLL